MRRAHPSNSLTPPCAAPRAATNRPPPHTAGHERLLPSPFRRALWRGRRLPPNRPLPGRRLHQAAWSPPLYLGGRDQRRMRFYWYRWYRYVGRRDLHECHVRHDKRVHQPAMHRGAGVVTSSWLGRVHAAQARGGQLFPSNLRNGRISLARAAERAGGHHFWGAQHLPHHHAEALSSLLGSCGPGYVHKFHHHIL